MGSMEWFAFVVGVEDYSAAYHSLEGCQVDVQLITSDLAHAQFDTAILGDVTKPQIVMGLAQFKAKLTACKQAGGSPLALFYFTGYGYDVSESVGPNTKLQDLCLVTKDGGIVSVRHEVEAELAPFADKLIVILDLCRTAELAKEETEDWTTTDLVLKCYSCLPVLVKEGSKEQVNMRGIFTSLMRQSLFKPDNTVMNAVKATLNQLKRLETSDIPWFEVALVLSEHDQGKFDFPLIKTSQAAGEPYKIKIDEYVQALAGTGKHAKLKAACQLEAARKLWMLTYQGETQAHMKYMMDHADRLCTIVRQEKGDTYEHDLIDAIEDRAQLRAGHVDDHLRGLVVMKQQDRYLLGRIANIMQNLACNDEYRDYLVRQGVVEPLVMLFCAVSDLPDKLKDPVGWLDSWSHAASGALMNLLTSTAGAAAEWTRAYEYLFRKTEQWAEDASLVHNTYIIAALHRLQQLLGTADVRTRHDMQGSSTHIQKPDSRDSVRLLVQLSRLLELINKLKAKALGEALKTNTMLQHLDRSSKSIAEMLAQVQDEVFNIQHLSFNSHSIGDAEVLALSGMLKTNTVVQRLDLHRNIIGAAGAQALGEALKTNTTLQHLNLYSNSISDTGAQALSEALKTNTTLQHLNLDSNNIGDAGAQALGEALKTNTTLQHLDLKRNSIRVDGAKALGEALETNTMLQHLELSSNNISDAGSQALGEALKTNTTLQHLELCTNNIGASGAQALGEVLKTNTTLQHLNLYNNTIEDAGAQALGEALETNTTLQHLNLNSNSIIAAGAKALGEALKTNTTLQHLNLSNNNIRAAGAQALGEALKTNTTLQHLNLYSNSIGDAGAQALGEALETGRVVV